MFIKSVRISFLTLAIGIAAPLYSQQSSLAPDLQEKFIKANEARKNGDLDSAGKLLQEVLQSGGKLPEVYNALGILWQSKGEHEKALSSFRAAAQIDVKDPQPRFLAGASLLALRRTGEAIREFKKAVQLQPDNTLVREQLARAQARTQDWPGAIEQYSRLMELQPENPEYRYQLGRAYGKYTLACFERIQALNPSSARLYQELGDQYLAQGKMEKTIESYEKARTADPSIPEIHFLLGQFYLKQGHKEKALQAINQALVLTPGNPGALALQRQIQGASAPTR
jgi:tetratricopeptide (TPR) repeat protein